MSLFTEEKYNALYQALEESYPTDDYIKDGNLMMSRKIVDKLEELGYIIVKR